MESQQKTGNVLVQNHFLDGWYNNEARAGDYLERFNCVLCNSKYFHLLYLVPGAYSEKTYRVVACTSCGMVQVHPRPSEGYLKSFYDQHFDVDPTFGTPSRISSFREVLTMLRERFPEPGLLLDVGCGHGHFAEIAKKFSWNVWGVDSSVSSCKICRDKGISVYCGELEEASFPDSHFDVVTMFHILEHVLAPRYLLAEAKRILKIGGLLLIRVPNFDSKISMLACPYWGSMNPPFHLNYFSPKILSRMLESTGFGVDLVTTRFSPEYNYNFFTELMFSVYLRFNSRTRNKIRSRGSMARKAWPWLSRFPIKEILTTPTFLDDDTEIVVYAYKQTA